MSDFEIVSDDLRTEGIGRGNLGPVTQALVDGKTVRLNIEYKAGRHVNALKKRGLRLRQHRTPEGVILWAVPIEPTNAE